MDGTATLTFTDADSTPHVVSLGTIKSISNTFQKKANVTPIVSLNMQSAFPLETGNSQSISISFQHYNGQDGKTNAEWYTELTQFVDRWQAKTNGCILNLTPPEAFPYQGDLFKNVGGYVKSLTRAYTSDFNELISGSLEFVVGTMCVNDVDPGDAGEGAVPYSSMYVLISDSKQLNWYPIMYGGDAYSEYNCIDSMTISGGLEDPFEHVEIKMPKKKLLELYPMLQGDIIDRQNLLMMDCLGARSMFVDQVKMSSNTVTIKAICHAQYYQERSITGTLTGKPYYIIQNILSSARYGVKFDLATQLVTNYSENEFNNYKLTIPSGTKVWRALQICATILRCRMFFADNMAYLLDYTLPIDDEHTMFIETIDLQGSNDYRRRVVSDTEIDPEGFAPVKNTAVIDAADASEEVYDPDKISYDKYESLSKGTIRVPEISGMLIQYFGQNHLIYLREPQRSATFTIKEMYGRSGFATKLWKSQFGVSAQAGMIVDRTNSDYVTNVSYLFDDGTCAYQKLCLSSYVRSFPEGTCKYTFGTVANVDLSNNISQTTNTLNA